MITTSSASYCHHTFGFPETVQPVELTWMQGGTLLLVLLFHHYPSFLLSFMSVTWRDVAVDSYSFTITGVSCYLYGGMLQLVFTLSPLREFPVIIH